MPGGGTPLGNIGFTLSQRESYAPSGVKFPPPHDIAMQTPPLHDGIAESVQSDAVATMVLPVKGIAKDIVVGSSTGAVDMVVVHVAGVGREVLVHSECTSD